MQQILKYPPFLSAGYEHRHTEAIPLLCLPRVGNKCKLITTVGPSFKKKIKDTMSNVLVLFQTNW